MDREARLALENAVADLREINNRLQRIVPKAQGQVRDELLEIQHQSEAAIRYYTYLLARSTPRKAPAIADRVGQAAFGANFVGLVPPRFALPRGTR
jgi:hypothetical protein